MAHLRELKERPGHGVQVPQGVNCTGHFCFEPKEGQPHYFWLGTFNSEEGEDPERGQYPQILLIDRKMAKQLIAELVRLFPDE
jgi:hypothetical protein